eukprot:6590437-Pyramimonas_sp.AAC.1
MVFLVERNKSTSFDSAYAKHDCEAPRASHVSSKEATHDRGAPRASHVSSKIARASPRSTSKVRGNSSMFARLTTLIWRRVSQSPNGGRTAPPTAG